MIHKQPYIKTDASKSVRDIFIIKRIARGTNSDVHHLQSGLGLPSEMYPLTLSVFYDKEMGNLNPPCPLRSRNYYRGARRAACDS